MRGEFQDSGELAGTRHQRNAEIQQTKRRVIKPAGTLVGFLLHISARRALDDWKAGVACLRRSVNGAAGMAFHPEVPVRPPASRLLLGLFQPILCVAIQTVIDPMTAPVAGRRVDHTSNVTAGGEHKARILFP